SAKRVSFDDTTMWVELSDARIIGVPLAWFPRLLLKELAGLVDTYQALFLEAWHEYFG
ncbi:DUF2442 domain-containing protein, partial [Enterobacter hormaechei]|uniref:DUF2442 domain-containing protein n=1 Tax=Enterobacter hormaechei TaxID=158836 RepID=UPI00197AD4EC